MQDNIVYYNINDSVYSLEYNNYKFYFSSEYYLNKFKDKFKNFIEEENYKLQSIFKINLDFKEMLLIYLYLKIEKRGFRIDTYVNNGWASIENYKFISKLELIYD